MGCETTGIACHRVNDLTVYDVTANSATVSWTAGDSTDSNWNVVLKNADGDTISTQQLNGTTIQQFNNLSPNQTYMVSVATVCDLNNSSNWRTTEFTTLQSCLPVSNLTVESVTYNSAMLSWNDLNGEYGTYEVMVVSNDSIISTINSQSTTVNLNGLAAETAYEVSVRALCSETDASEWVSTNLFTGYCMPNPTSLDGQGITSVSFGGMTNTNHPSGAPFYGNYSEMSGSVAAGTPVTVDITFATGYTYGTIIWVDWNSNMLFEGDEVVCVGVSENTNPTTMMTTFNVPATQAIGNYRMRIVAADSYFDSYTSSIEAAANANPCATYTWGVAEDYTLTVTEAPSCLPVSGVAVSDVTAHTATVSWTSDADSWQICINDNEDSLIDVTDLSYTFIGLTAESAYSVKVRSICNATDYSPWCNPVTFTTGISCPAPTSLVATLTPGNGTVASLSWNESGVATTWTVEYDTNAAFNGSTVVNSQSLTVGLTGLIAEATYYARVKAVCGGEDGESQWSNTIAFTPTNTYAITVNDGTTTNGYVPIYGYYCDDYTKSQFIIPADDLTAMTYGTVNRLVFYSADASKSWGNAQFEVYMTETSNTILSGLADYTEMNQVMLSGTLSVVDGMMEVTLDDPYQYMGGNLLIGFNQPVSGSYSSVNWYGVSATNGASWGGHGSSINAQSFLPKTTLYCSW
jgi:hypothetical protein